MTFSARSLFLTLLVTGITSAAVAQQNPEAAPNLSPKQQINGFYATCKSGAAGTGLREMLSANPHVKPEDIDGLAAAFEQLLDQMGGFIDFEVIREKEITDRIVVISCAAHFERQPFMNEFTFYDPGKGSWRLVHLRYDKNLATMFSDENREEQATDGR